MQYDRFMRRMSLLLALLPVAATVAGQSRSRPRPRASRPRRSWSWRMRSCSTGKAIPVEGLGQDDFVIREDGVPQAIVRFEAVGLSESAATPAAASRFVSSNTGAAAPRTPAALLRHRLRRRPALGGVGGERPQGPREVPPGGGPGRRRGPARLHGQRRLVVGPGREWCGPTCSRCSTASKGQRQYSTASDLISDYEAMRIYREPGPADRCRGAAALPREQTSPSTPATGTRPRRSRTWTSRGPRS